jgi:hypothetical protein
VPLSFRYDSSDEQALNRDWLRRLMVCADTAGLRALPEQMAAVSDGVRASPTVADGALVG